jgi:predicted acylesterase/phospholipase RssA
MRRIEDVLYLVPPEGEQRARNEMERLGGRPRRGALGKDWMVLSVDQIAFQCRFANEVSQALSLLVDHYFNFVVIDNRGVSGAVRDDCFANTIAKQFMDRVHYSGDPERMYPLQRILCVLDDDACLSVQAFELGKLKIGGFIVNPFDAGAPLFKELGRRALERAQSHGKTAICLSGGGVEGFLFEVGVLKALNAHLQSRSVTDFDIYCGISAGSILAAFIANGAEPEYVAAALTGDRTAGVDAFTPSTIFDPDIKEYLARIWKLARQLPMMSWSETISNLLKTVPVGFFKGAALKEFVEKQLAREGRSNDFRTLERELYIGATDQDTSAHVVFGWGQWRDIPIATAVRASCGLTPFFEPEKIRGRYFVDGQYTRTSNFHFAVERGAKLVIVVNPLVPVRVEQPGYVRAKGGVFAGLQALKAVIHTRFMHSIRHAAETYPDIDFVLFHPESEDMRLLSGSPMKYSIRTEILNMAYRCTVRKIQRDFEILGGTFAKHGFRLQRYPRMRSAPLEVV